MNKAILAAMLVALAGSVTAETISREERIARAGGEIIKRGTFTGKVSIINCQEQLAAEDCAKVAEMLAAATGCNIVMDDGEGATIKLWVVDEPETPVLLLAPEDRWGKVNVAKLATDLQSERARAKFFASRGRKMILKGMSILMGGGSSQFPGNVMNTATMRELDHAQEIVPMDMVNNYEGYLKSLGVTPKEMVTYRKACREGWAPEPQDEVQRAIWEEVKARQSEEPNNPIRIKAGQKPMGKKAE